MIIPAKKEHSEEIAELHYLYVESLLRRFGKRMCTVFYNNALVSEQNFGFVYIERSKIFGFVFGTEDNSRMFNNSRIYAHLAFTLCKNPYLIKRVIFRLLNKFPPAPELAYVAVAPLFRGKGIGKQLLQAQHEEFRKRGVNRYEIRVDADNVVSLSLYRKLGAEVTDEFLEGEIFRLRLENSL